MPEGGCCLPDEGRLLQGAVRGQRLRDGNGAGDRLQGACLRGAARLRGGYLRSGEVPERVRVLMSYLIRLRIKCKNKQ